MSAKDHEHGEHDPSPHHDDHGDNYAAAYAPAAPLPATPTTPRPPPPRSTATGSRCASSRARRGCRPTAATTSSRRHREVADRSAVAPQLLPADGRVDGARRRRRVPALREGRDRPARAPPRGPDPGPDARSTRPRSSSAGSATRCSRPRSRVARSSSTATPSTRSRAAAIVTGHRSATPARTTFAQAAILHLYDPDRSQSAARRRQGRARSRAFRAALAELRNKLARPRASCREASSSPTVQRAARQLLAKYQGLSWHEYEPLSWDNERDRHASSRSAARCARSRSSTARETIVTIDCDLFVEHPAAMRYSRDFARSRRNGRLARRSAR